MRTIKALLTARCVPFDGCIEREDLLRRCQQSHRGSLLGLPAPVLLQMLEQFGGQVRGRGPQRGCMRPHVCALQMERYVEKENLARRVMALRAEYRRQASNPTRKAEPTTRRTSSADQQCGCCVVQ